MGNKTAFIATDTIILTMFYHKLKILAKREFLFGNGLSLVINKISSNRNEWWFWTRHVRALTAAFELNFGWMNVEWEKFLKGKLIILTLHSRPVNRECKCLQFSTLSPQPYFPYSYRISILFAQWCKKKKDGKSKVRNVRWNLMKTPELNK